MLIPFQVDSRGKALLGLLHIPEHTGVKRPVTLMCYGFNGHRVDNNRISVKFGRQAEQNGIIMCRYDFRGLGISDGHFVDMTMDTKLYDAKEVLAFIDGCMQGSPYDLYLIGFSDGLRMVARLLLDGVQPHGILLWSPIFYINAKYVEQKKRRRFMRDPETNQIAFPFSGLFVNPETIREQTQNNNDYDILCNSSAKKLCIFGENDPATLAVAQEVKAESKYTLQAEYKYISGADHLFSRHEWTNQLIETSIEWILAN